MPLPRHPFSVLIVAAGHGSRMGSDTPKQYLDLGGKTVLRQTIDVFYGLPGLQEIHIVIDPAHKALYESSITGLSLPTPCYGGDSRKESVYRGLLSFSNALDNDILLIHDAARPLVKKDRIFDVIQALENESSEAGFDAATLALPVSETLRRGSNGIAENFVDRDGLWAIQTPQAFRYGPLRRAHETAPPGIYTDDTGLVSAMGLPVRFVPGHRNNIKITTPEDLDWARGHIMTEPEKGVRIPETRTATGFDVHAFTEKGEKNAVRLCGIDIPAPFGLVGHSDADAGLHALTDALLGTIAAGDIGTHFSPADPRWKGADSRVFIEHATGLVRRKSGRIVHVDLTILCEVPKIGPYRTVMQESVAKMLDISRDRVSIKATTTEGLGFLGRREGLAAQATVSVEFPREPDHDPEMTQG
ncbi:MAG: 2-C-methyl-D-erythritol 4-phosphate cytidylyltransferase [Rhodospirillales bacterium]|nr:2-C-methyl-D-erythritol 4-phosphate cytidylyltransferase [Rhodospirillales bacterium]